MGCTSMIDDQEIRDKSHALLMAHWDKDRRYTYPNVSKYPHQWLWDSCFAAISWEAVGEHDNAVSELANVLSGQFDDGFVPHIRYAKPNRQRGPLSDVSSFTQPPVYAHTARFLSRSIPVSSNIIDKIAAALDWLWTKRRTEDGLIYIVHPWESGADDSPRWDSWMTDKNIDKLKWNRVKWTLFDKKLLGAAKFDDTGEAVGSSAFVCAPAGFNAVTCFAAQELAHLTSQSVWSDRAEELAQTMDSLLWNNDEKLWCDRPIVGGGRSAAIPTLDGVLPALVTQDKEKANRSLDQLLDINRFNAPYGLGYVARNHSAYNPNGYWRGTAWMQMNYLASLASRRWERENIASAIRSMSREGALRSGFAEHWNPETGEGHGAIPLTWSALVAAL